MSNAHNINNSSGSPAELVFDVIHGIVQWHRIILNVTDLLELGNTTRQLTELAGRTVSTPHDAVMALIELGTRVMDLPLFLNDCSNHGTLVIGPRMFNDNLHFIFFIHPLSFGISHLLNVKLVKVEKEKLLD